MGGGLGERTVESLGWSGLSAVVRPLIRYAGTIILYRILGPAGFGILVLILSVVDSIVLYADAGITTAVQRFLPEMGGAAQERSFLRLAVMVKSALIGLCVAAILAFPGSLLGATGLSDPSTAIVIAVCALIIERSARLYYEARLTATLRIRTVAVYALLFGALATGAATGAAAIAETAAATALGMLLVEGAQTMALAREARRRVNQTAVNGIPVSLVRAGRYLGSQAILRAGRYVQGPAYAALVLGAATTTSDVAAFAVTFTLVSGALGVAISPVSTLSTTLIAAAYASSLERGARMTVALTTLAMIVVAPVAIFLAGFGGPLIAILFGHDAGIDGVGLVSLSLGLAVAFVSGVAFATLQNRERFTAVNGISAATLMLGGGLVIAGALASGPEGAAIGLAVGAAIGSLPAFVLASKEPGVGLPRALAWRLLASCAPLAGLAIATHALGVAPVPAITVGAIGLAIFYLAFRQLGGIGADERARLAATQHPLAQWASRWL